MADVVSKKKRSEIMSRIKNKNSRMELFFMKALGAVKLRHRRNAVGFFGKPDIVFVGKKLVVFLDSCFWHGCEEHCRIPTIRKAYWAQKIARNVARDKEVTKYYKKQGWKIFRFWEHELKVNPEGATKKVIVALVSRVT